MARNPKPPAEKTEKPVDEAGTEGADLIATVPAGKTPAEETEEPVGEAGTHGAEQAATVPTGETPTSDVSANNDEHALAAAVENAKASAELPKAVNELADTVQPIPHDPMVLDYAPKEMVVVVTAPVPRRRRAGRAFGLTPTRIPVDQLTGDEFDALADDPLLKVHMEPVEDPTGE